MRSASVCCCCCCSIEQAVVYFIVIVIAVVVACCCRHRIHYRHSSLFLHKYHYTFSKHSKRFETIQTLSYLFCMNRLRFDSVSVSIFSESVLAYAVAIVVVVVVIIIIVVVVVVVHVRFVIIQCASAGKNEVSCIDLVRCARFDSHIDLPLSR